MAIALRTLNQIARQADVLRQVFGNMDGAERLQVLLEQHNCCVECGTQLIFDPDYYERTGLWMCPCCAAERIAS